jgi:hypothetical protein
MLITPNIADCVRSPAAEPMVAPFILVRASACASGANKVAVINDVIAKLSLSLTSNLAEFISAHHQPRESSET